MTDIDDDKEESEDYLRGWNDSIAHHTGPETRGGYRGPCCKEILTDYERGWNDAWYFL